MTVPDSKYDQTGRYHEFYTPERDDSLPNCLEVYLHDEWVSVYTHDKMGNTVDLNLSDARILRDILTEHIARQERKPA